MTSRRSKRSGWLHTWGDKDNSSSQTQRTKAPFFLTYLPELHDKIEEVGGGGVLARSLAGGGLKEVFDGDPLTKTMIQSPLTCGQVTAQVDLNLKWCVDTRASIQPWCVTSLVPRPSPPPRNANMYSTKVHDHIQSLLASFPGLPCLLIFPVSILQAAGGRKGLDTRVVLCQEVLPTFSAISCSTSRLILRSMKGLRIMCSRESCSWSRADFFSA